MFPFHMNNNEEKWKEKKIMNETTTANLLVSICPHTLIWDWMCSGYTHFAFVAVAIDSTIMQTVLFNIWQQITKSTPIIQLYYSYILRSLNSNQIKNWPYWNLNKFSPSAVRRLYFSRQDQFSTKKP